MSSSSRRCGLPRTPAWLRAEPEGCRRAAGARPAKIQEFQSRKRRQAFSPQAAKKRIQVTTYCHEPGPGGGHIRRSGRATDQTVPASSKEEDDEVDREEDADQAIVCVDHRHGHGLRLARCVGVNGPPDPPPALPHRAGLVRPAVRGRPSVADQVLEPEHRGPRGDPADRRSVGSRQRVHVVTARRLEIADPAVGRLEAD